MMVGMPMTVKDGSRRTAAAGARGSRTRSRRRQRRMRFEALEDRCMLNAAPIAGDDVFSTSPGTTLDAALVNGTFETGDLTGWDTFTTPGGTLGGAGFPDLVAFDTNNDSVQTEGVQFLVGDGGGGIFQNVQLSASDVTINADIAVSAPVDNSDVGLFELMIDGVVVDSHDFGPLAAGASAQAALSATLTDVATGEHEIRFQVTRSGPSSFGTTPFSYIDNVMVFGHAASVLANDSDPDGDVLSSLLVTRPEDGTLGLNPDGSFRYVPDGAFTGDDSFNYKAVDQGQGLSLYTVDHVNDKLLKIDSGSGELSIVGSIGYDMRTVDMTYMNGVLYTLDVGGGTYTLVSIDPITGAKIAAVPITGGTLTAAKGITAVGDELFLIYGVSASYCGSACGSAHILGRLDTTTGALASLVNYRNLDGGFNHDFSALSTSASGQIIAHRRASNGIIQVYVLGYDPPSLTFLGQTELPESGMSDVALAGSNVYLLNTNGDFLHRFDPEGTGYVRNLENISIGPQADTLSGLAFAPDLQTETATVTITVPGPESPVAVDDDSYTVDEDEVLVVDAAAGVLANDNDPQVDPITAVVTRQPFHGALNINPDGSFEYTPEADYFGQDSFRYQASDGLNKSNVATVSIAVNPLPDPPVAVNDGYSINEDESIVASLTVLANDTDADGDALTASLVSDVANGALTLNPDGTFNYEPNANFFGSDGFTYMANDGMFDSNIATVNITVRSVNDIPTVVDDDYLRPFGGSLDVLAAEGVLANDSDVETAGLTAVLGDSPTQGSLTLNPDGSFEYTPDGPLVFSDSFTYRADDGSDESDLATVTITLDVPAINVGAHLLAPNTPGQTIEIFVAGGQDVSGLNLFAQVGDGGPELADFSLPAGTDGPAITSVDLKSGTLFAGVPDEPVDQSQIPQVANWFLAIQASGGTIPADGLLATLTIDTTGFFVGTWDLLLKDVLPDLGGFDTDFAGTPAKITNGSLQIASAQVVDRHIFYNNSAFDGNDPAASLADLSAIATDKTALLPGRTASFANYTSYSRGINGVMVDVSNLADRGSLTAADFQFRVGNSDNPSDWPAAPPAQVSISVREGGGTSGSDRVTIVWPDGAIQKQWLQVVMKANINTGLLNDDVFYFGNAVGGSGNSTSDALVNATDIIGARDNPHGPLDQATITDEYDFNRDRLVNATDLILARNNATSPFTALRLFEAPGDPVGGFDDEMQATIDAAAGNITIDTVGLTVSGWRIESAVVGRRSFRAGANRTVVTVPEPNRPPDGHVQMNNGRRTPGPRRRGQIVGDTLTKEAEALIWNEGFNRCDGPDGLPTRAQPGRLSHAAAEREEP